ncbi:hypothetical protein DYB28_006122, partial [Aphanomyces astaci]
MVSATTPSRTASSSTPNSSSSSSAPNLSSSSSQARAAMTPGDFVFGSVLGQGSFAKVYHAQFKKTKANFAVKVMDQEFIKKHKKVPFVVMERQVMSKLSHPNIVKFYCSFKVRDVVLVSLITHCYQDDESLYMVMELCRGGELLSYIWYHREHVSILRWLDDIVCSKERDAAKAQGAVDTACSVAVVQFYMAQLIVALRYIHSNIADSNEHATNFCGTAEYLSPEVLNDLPACEGSDLWAVGCILFQMLTGRPPFRGENDFLTFQQILSHDSDAMEFPAHIPEAARDLIRRLLVLDLDARLTDYDTIQAHPFFEGVDWTGISTATPPVVPDKTHLPTPTMVDGASPNWSLANVLNDVFGATPLLADDPRHHPIPPTSARRHSTTTSSSSILENNEGILLQADVKLHGSLFTKKARGLMFTTHGRLIVSDAKNQPPQVFQWGTNAIHIVPKNTSTFDIRY